MECTTIKDEVGHVTFTALADIKEFYIDYFEVHDIYRGQGYGSEIFNWIEAYAKRKGMRTIFLTPYQSAVNFWVKMGFSHPSRDSDEMLKTLHPSREQTE